MTPRPVSYTHLAVDILPGDTPEVLQKRVMEQAEWKLLPKAVAMVCSGHPEDSPASA